MCWNLFRMQIFTKAAPGAAASSALGGVPNRNICTHSRTGNHWWLPVQMQLHTRAHSGGVSSLCMYIYLIVISVRQQEGNQCFQFAIYWQSSGWRTGPRAPLGRSSRRRHSSSFFFFFSFFSSLASCRCGSSTVRDSSVEEQRWLTEWNSSPWLAFISSCPAHRPQSRLTLLSSRHLYIIYRTRKIICFQTFPLTLIPSPVLRSACSSA